MRPAGSKVVFTLLAIFCIAADTTRTIDVTITSVAGKSVIIDKGRTSGITEGSRVRFTPAGTVMIEGVVVDVSSSTARVEIHTADIPPLLTRGTVDVPVIDQTPSTQPTTLPTSIPAHPPWERHEGARTPDMPLLSPAFSKSPSERPPVVHGRAFSDFQFNLDNSQSINNRFYFARTGLAFTMTNPFGQGGELGFNGEYDYRGINSENGNDDTNYNLIITQLSYAIGTDEHSPYRLEFGRFTSYYLPEIGWVDGVEGAVRLKNGLNLGGGFGGYPDPYPDQDIGQDLGFHLFADYASSDPNQLAATIGYQKTWRDGNPDRDRVVARASIWPTKSLWLYGSSTVDIYNNADTLKSSGPHLTDAWLQARYTPNSWSGGSISYSHYSWTNIRTPTLPLVPNDLIREGTIDRTEFSIWHDIVPNLRPTARVSYVNDDVTSGAGGEIDLDWSNIASQPLTWHNAIFYSDGLYVRDYGFRTQLSVVQGNFDCNLGYELLRSNYPDTETNSGSFNRHNIRAGVGWQLDHWYYNLNFDYYFGDENAYGIGAYIEYRF